jgi:hypothetical protein
MSHRLSSWIRVVSGPGHLAETWINTAAREPANVGRAWQVAHGNILDYAQRDIRTKLPELPRVGPQRNISNFFCLHAYATGLKRHRSDYEGVAETPGTTALWSEVNGFNVGATCDLATGPARRRPNAVSTDVGPDRRLVPGLNARVLAGRRGSRVGVLMKRAVATW